MQFGMLLKSPWSKLLHYYNGNDTKFAKRSGIIKEGENFFNYETVLEEFRPKIINAFNYIKKKYETNETIINLVQFYGELFGGAYPHPDVPRNSQFNSVQKDFIMLLISHFMDLI